MDTGRPLGGTTSDGQAPWIIEMPSKLNLISPDVDVFSAHEDNDCAVDTSESKTIVTISVHIFLQNKSCTEWRSGTKQKLILPRRMLL
jgi:hypothetical protein